MRQLSSSAELIRLKEIDSAYDILIRTAANGQTFFHTRAYVEEDKLLPAWKTMRDGLTERLELVERAIAIIKEDGNSSE